MPAAALDLVTRGWELPGWDLSFYPEDLPPDWRLTYFSNELPAVLIPGSLWAKADESLLRTWVEDVHRDFRFYLADPGASGRPISLDLARRILGDRLAGLVLERPIGDASDERNPRFQLLANASQAPARDYLPAWRVPPGLIREPRSARSWIESLDVRATDGRGLLVFGPETGVDDLRRWWDLARLLGIAA